MANMIHDSAEVEGISYGEVRPLRNVEECKIDIADVAKLFDGYNIGEIDELKKMIRCNSLDEALIYEHRLSEHLEIRNSEKGSITNDYKVKSLKERWFNEK